MADVAELLLRDGYPVMHVGSCQPEHMEPLEDDGGGYVDFAPEVLAQVNGTPQDAQELHFVWDTSSGWGLVTEQPKAKEVTRWMGGGLTPGPEKVAGFFLTGLLDFRNAGSEERPYYRQPGHDIDGLAERLAPFHRKGSFDDRFRRARNATAERLAIDAVLTEDTVVSIPARAGELAALQHLVHFVVMSEELRGVAVKLIGDLKARAVAMTDEEQLKRVTSHSDGVEQAKQLRRMGHGRD
ncbi:DUF6292 family protein [Streptomyces sp. ME19-01-6]|uniref:DUF6292 family protein n=1 Tax=Streptomyces sp. ME19-01-6 TaxID=3028686 RepID=UPI0029B4A70F|nr:DUF6292 family protein [Streptomyces sp. ME19-01-6]MDX3232501.1 DUF6292 family protein [Streptomyces sp. ME19-01-6]